MKYVFLIIFIIIFNKVSYSEEYVCKCVSNKVFGVEKKADEKHKSFKRNKCFSSEITLDYEDGYIALILQNGNVQNFDITNEKSKYVKAEAITDPKNYTKIHFNKKNKVLRIKKERWFYTDAYSVGNMFFDSFGSNSESNIKLQCS